MSASTVVRRLAASHLLLALCGVARVAGAASEGPSRPASEGSGAPGAPDGGTIDALLDRARVLLGRLGAAEKDLGEKTAALASNREILEGTRVRAAAVSVPDRQPPPAPEDASPAEAAKRVQDHAAARLEALKERKALLEVEKGVLEERAKRLDACRAAGKALDEVIAGLQPIAAEVEAMAGAGKIPAERIPEGLSVDALKERSLRLADVRKAWQDDAGQLQESLKGMLPRIEQAGASMKDAEADLASAAGRYHELSRREVFAKEFGDKEPGALAALLSGLESQREGLARAFQTTLEGFGEAHKALDKAEAALKALSPPNPDAIPLEATTQRVREREKVLRLAKAMAAYQAARAEGLGRLQGVLAQVCEKGAAVAKEAAVLEDHLVRLRVLAETVARLRSEGLLPPGPLPRNAEPAVLADARSRVMNEAAGVAGRAEAAKVRLGQVEKQIAEAREAAKAEGDRLQGLAAAYEAARASARWTKEVEKLETPQVVNRFKESLEGWRKGEADLAAARKELEKAEAAISDIETKLRGLEDPIVRRAQQQGQTVRRIILVDLYKVLQFEPPEEAPEGTADATKRAETPPPSSPPVGAVPPSSPQAKLAAAIEERQTTLASRERILNERLQRRAELLEALRRAAAAAVSLGSRYNAAIEKAHQAYGAALELQARVGLKEVSTDALPDEVSAVLKRDRIVSMETELKDLRARQTTLEERITAAGKGSDELAQKRDLLTQGLDVANRKLDGIRERGQLESQFERDPGKLSETERKRIDQEVVRRLEEENDTGEFILGVFQSRRAEELTELLRAYYRDLLDLERKLDNLEDRRRVTQRLVRLAEQERKYVEAVLPLARREWADLRAAEADLRIRAGLAAPTDKEAVAALEAVGRAVPGKEALVTGKPEEIAAMVDRLFDARVRVLAWETWIRDLEGRLSRLGIDADIGIHQDEIGALVARADGVRLEAERLRGHPREALARLDEGETPRTDDAMLRFLRGEIGYTRALRRDVLVRAAIVSGLSLIAIPILAFLLIRAAGMLGMRIVKRVRESSEGGALEREQRAKTLVHVFKAAWTVVVCLVAGIYMLKQLRVDVTPILASAGVAGLAFAFGAQTLVRDFFAGFFMLLENQYRIGDIIKIGDTGGVVEQITLRLTVLRDLQGVVHYIPNGTVQQVSNMTKGWSRAVLEIGVAYREDPDRVMEALRTVGQEMFRDPVYGPKLVELPEVPGVESFGDSAVTVRMMLKTRPGEQWTIAREARRRIKKAFDDAGIEIPFPQRVLYHFYPEGAEAGARSEVSRVPEATLDP